MAKLLRVNMTDRTASLQELPEAYKHLGGRAMTSTIVHDEVDPCGHALGPSNKLVFAPGMVTGTSSPTSSRLSVGGKSPLTGGIKEANAGTGFAPALASLGIRALVVEGCPKDKSWWMLRIWWDGATGQPKTEWLPADKYVGKDLYEVYPQLFERFGKVNIGGIGIAGELMYSNSGVVFEDMEGHPARYAGRGGLGAVLGSKHLKFIILDRKGAPGVPIANKEVFEGGRKKLTDALMSHAITKPKGALNSYGTAVLINILNEAGGLPTRNFSSGRFEDAAKIAGEAIFEGNKERLGGKELYNHACSPGCIIRCSNTWHKPDGSEHVSCQEYESVWAFGANCGIGSLDDTGELIRLCNAYGVDTIEMGCTMAVAMEGGLLAFGDAKRAIELLHEVGKGTPLGRLLGNGTATAARLLGVRRVPVVKGQAMPAYEPRAVKGIGITYAISTMGADHTSGYTIAPEILGVSGKVDQFDRDKATLARNFQYATAYIDSTGHCLFIAFAILDIASGFEGSVEECNGVLGTKWTMDDVSRIGKEVLDKELAFNRAAGLGKEADRMPEFMKIEKLPPHQVTWDVPDSTLDAVFG